MLRTQNSILSVLCLMMKPKEC